MDGKQGALVRLLCLFTDADNGGKATLAFTNNNNSNKVIIIRLRIIIIMSSAISLHIAVRAVLAKELSFESLKV